MSVVTLHSVVDGMFIFIPFLSFVSGALLLLWALFTLKPQSFNHPFLKYSYWPFLVVVLFFGIQYSVNTAQALKVSRVQLLIAALQESPDRQSLERALEAWVHHHSPEACKQEPLKSSTDPLDRFYCNSLKPSH
jgi:hypothetical protein